MSRAVPEALPVFPYGGAHPWPPREAAGRPRRCPRPATPAFSGCTRRTGRRPSEMPPPATGRYCGFSSLPSFHGGTGVPDGRTPGTTAGLLSPALTNSLLPTPAEGATLPRFSFPVYNGIGKRGGVAEAGALRSLPTRWRPGGDRSIILQAGPLLVSFLMFDEITAFRDLVPSEFVLYFALVGLLLSLFLAFCPRPRGRGAGSRSSP